MKWISLLMIFKKTKIVATIGPATESKAVLGKLVDAGLNVMRLNFSHGDFAEHQTRVNNLREVMKEKGQFVGILQDLAGPKIRIGEFYKECVTLVPGESFTLTTDKIVGDEHNAYVNYPTLPKELKKGHLVLLDDGKKKLEVISTTQKTIKCKILVGGETKGKRGVNLPGAYLKISSITEKDRKDLEFGIKNKVDFVALSFVRRPEDIEELRVLLKKVKSEAMIVAKIETEEAVENIDAIIRLTDAVMVARGDLAIEIGAENVPMIQKQIIKKCRLAGKPVITATQMLESMIKFPIPTRAEVSDVANAILDGTDAIMLSEETTLGDYPLEAVKMMTTVALRVEKEYPRKDVIRQKGRIDEIVVSDCVSDAVVEIAENTAASFIAALTYSGKTARTISRFKPLQPILAISPKEKTCQQLSVSFGCLPICVQKISGTVDAMDFLRKYLTQNKIAKKGEKVVITSGWPFGKNIDTNMLIVETL